MSLKANGESDEVTAQQTIQGWLKDIGSQLGRIPEDLGVLNGLVGATLTDGTVNDRKYLLEKIIQLACSLPHGSPGEKKLTGELLDNLWNNLKHPPLSYMGDDWRYRTADGSNNNILYPDLGKAGSAYARSVVPQHSPPAALPDPASIFDALFARKGPAREHPAKFSSLAIALATIIIHDIFRTDDVDPSKHASSAYLDLGPLYGHNAEQQKTIRTFQDGKIKPDAFAEPRLLGQPPGVCALIVSFNRFHNYVVQQLALINEAGRFSIPVTVDPQNKAAYEKALAKRDNDLFQTGRLVTCGLYVNIILHDYVRVILNLNRSNTQWNLDPRVDSFNIFDPEGTPKGIGNQVSVEFNLIYRWHATVSDKNAKWLEGFFDKVFPGIDPDTITQAEFLKGLKAWGHGIDSDPGKWTFGGLQRTATGGFDDGSLVKLLTEETEDVAGAFGARNIPAILKAVDVLGINQGRAWGAASLNEVRKFFNLKPHETFLEINPDPDVAASLEALYSHPDNVELYPGVSVEDTKPPLVPGSGLCSGLTIAKAILSDAVALVRGDRFYSVDNSPANLTAFGSAVIASDLDVGAGTVIYKLLMHAYPGWYRGDSVYSLFPLTIPSENRKIAKDLGRESDYTYDPPSFAPQPIPVTTWQGVVDILKDQVNYKVPWGPHVYELIRHDWMLSGDKPWNAEQKSFCQHALYGPSKGLDQIRDYYGIVTEKLIREKSHKMRDTYQLDAVRDVGNLSHSIVVARIFNIPIKENGGAGTVTAGQLYDAMAAVFAYTFLDIDPAKTQQLRVVAKTATTILQKLITPVVESVKAERFHMLKDIIGISADESTLPDYGTHLVQRLFEGGKSLDEVIWTIVPTASAAGPIQSQAFARLLDFYLSENNKDHWAEIQKIAHQDTPEAFEKLRKYALEGLRLATPAFGVLRAVNIESATVVDGERQIPVKRGDTIFADFVTANVDAKAFPDPLEIKLDRPDSSYIHQGYGGHICLGRPIVMISMAVQLGAFARLKNLRRAPGPAGQLKATTVNGAFQVYMNEDWSEWTPFPANMKVQFDGF